ncbi:MAG: transposase [Nitrosospira sp.]|nr:transposase [Nitrosospira sp.]MDN5835939.1 transposase [Nitrosospira sp.]
MPRKMRFYLPGMPAHVMQRGHNRGPVFFSEQDYFEYLRCLKHAADTYGCKVHAYVLMTNHVHLLVTPESKESVGQLFQGLGRHYVRYVNETYQRHGGLWEGRHKGNIIQSQRYLLSCMRYIEMNPVRAGMVDHPAKYRWSSYAANAFGMSNAILNQHEEYIGLGASTNLRRKGYQELFDCDSDCGALELLRQSLQSGTPLGNDQFKARIETVVGQKVGSIGPGRPKRNLQGTR